MRGQFGQLGLGTIVDVCSPTKVETLAPAEFRGLACGWRHTMAVTAGGDVFSWGRGVNGQLGHGDGQDSCVPCLPAQLLGLTRRLSTLACAPPAVACWLLGAEPSARGRVSGGVPAGQDGVGGDL